MPQEILEYLKTQNVGVLAVEMPNGSPHAATLHYANTENPIQFYFGTDKTSRKVESLLVKPSTRASFVVGSNEGDMRTLQLDGVISLVPAHDNQNFESVYFGKFPQKLANPQPAEQANLVFRPNWWRFTDWTKSADKMTTTSED